MLLAFLSAAVEALRVPLSALGDQAISIDADEMVQLAIEKTSNGGAAIVIAGAQHAANATLAIVLSIVGVCLLVCVIVCCTCCRACWAAADAADKLAHLGDDRMGGEVVIVNDD